MFSGFSVEGLFFQFTTSINNFGNNLFATNIHVPDTQFGLIQTIPNLVAIILLLPFGILYDKTKSIRTIPVLTLSGMAAGYIILFLSTLIKGYQIPLFFFAISFTMGGTVLYNSQWQTFFGDVVAVTDRNEILKQRNRFMSFTGIIAPIICGFMMGIHKVILWKTNVLRYFFLSCAIAVLLQIMVLFRISVPKTRIMKKEGSLSEVKASLLKLSRDKTFLFFFITIVFFYMTWQMDWSVWYIGQVDYIGFNEVQLSVYNGICSIGQLIAIGYVARLVHRKSADYALTYGILGLVVCPLIMIFTSMIPGSSRIWIFTILVTVLNATQCVINLCIVQILLRVSQKECRSISVSVYTLTITFTNSFVPFIGMKIYTSLGADYRAFLMLFSLITGMRLLAFFFLWLRLQYIGKHPYA